MFFLSKNETFSAIPSPNNPLFIIHERPGAAWNGPVNLSPHPILSCGTKTKTMQQQDDLRALEKVVQFMRGISVLFVVINVYWFCHG